jgi:hypothetical protein
VLALLLCMNERDTGPACSRARHHVHSDMDIAGWELLGGGGARKGELARLGNTRDAEVRLRALAWSERQRGSVGLKVVYLGGC